MRSKIVFFLDQHYRDALPGEFARKGTAGDASSHDQDIDMKTIQSSISELRGAWRRQCQPVDCEPVHDSLIPFVSGQLARAHNLGPVVHQSLENDGIVPFTATNACLHLLLKPLLNMLCPSAHFPAP